MARVSVITATYNSAATLRMALATIRHQSYSDFEVWVIGDACTDDSERIVASLDDGRFQWINRERNSGSQALPNNDGLSRAQGEFVAYLGHDDLWFPWHLARLVERLDRSGADLAFSMTIRVGPNQSSIVGTSPAGPGFKMPPPSSWLHRRDLVQRCGQWPDPDKLDAPVDTAYFSRIERSGAWIEFVEELNVIKFPSWLWRMYALTSGHPQKPYLEDLEKDPTGLQQRLLARAAPSRSDVERRENRLRRLLEVVKHLRHTITTWYGRNRWPLPQLRIMRFQRQRKKKRVERGLER